MNWVAGVVSIAVALVVCGVTLSPRVTPAAAMNVGLAFQVFTGDTPMAVVVHHARTPPAPPSQRSELPVPGALDELILQCLAKSPADRPQSARELAHRLSLIDESNPWTEDRAREWWEAHQPLEPVTSGRDRGRGAG